jgi:hypothetical protein
VPRMTYFEECTYFRKNGRCKNGEKCRFSHNVAQPDGSLSVGRSDQKSKSPKLGARSQENSSASPRMEPSAVSVPKQAVICTFFLKSGRCKNGENCRYMHSFSNDSTVPAEVRVADAENDLNGDINGRQQDLEPLSPNVALGADSPVAIVKGIKVSSEMTNRLRNFVGTVTVGLILLFVT